MAEQNKDELAEALRRMSAGEVPPEDAVGPTVEPARPTVAGAGRGGATPGVRLATPSPVPAGQRPSSPTVGGGGSGGGGGVVGGGGVGGGGGGGRALPTVAVKGAEFRPDAGARPLGGGGAGSGGGHGGVMAPVMLTLGVLVGLTGLGVFVLGEEWVVGSMPGWAGGLGLAAGAVLVATAVAGEARRGRAVT